MAELDTNTAWYKVAELGLPADGERLHATIEGRYVTVFRHHNKLSCIDAICHHAGGPLTLGRIQDIEDLGVSVVLCPWHAFMVTLDGGLKAYQAVKFTGSKPVNAGWTLGKVVQRPHKVEEREDGLYVVSTHNDYNFKCHNRTERSYILHFYATQSLQITSEPCSSDRDSYSVPCARDYDISAVCGEAPKCVHEDDTAK